MKKGILITGLLLCCLGVIFSLDIEKIKSELIAEELKTLDYERMTPEQKGAVERIILKVGSATPDNREVQSAVSAQGNLYRMLSVEQANGDLVKCTDGTLIRISSVLNYLVYGKKAVLYQQDGRWKVWIEGKRSYSCEVLNEGTAERLTGVITSIAKADGNGGSVQLSDGSRYDISGIDSAKVKMWSYGNPEVLITADGYMINLSAADSPIKAARTK